MSKQAFKFKWMVLGCLLWVVGLSSVFASAAVVTVQQGDDLASKIMAAHPGDTVLVSNGTYGGIYGVYLEGKQGNPSAWITVKAGPGQTPIIEGGDWRGVGLMNCAYIQFQGFAFQGVGFRGNPSSAAIGIDKASHHIKIMNNIIFNFPGAGISAINSNHILVQGNVISNVAFGHLPYNPLVAWDESAISFYQLTDQGGSIPSYDGYTNVVRNNIVTNAHNESPFVYSNPPAITDGNCIIMDDHKLTQPFGQGVQSGGKPITGITVIENNLCYNNGGRGVNNYLTNNILVRNNTLYNNSYTSGIEGELTANESSNLQFYNNIVVARSGKPYILNYHSTNIIFKNNMVWGSDLYSGDQGTVMKADPLFVDAAQHNFALQATSPAANNGLSSQCPAFDILGRARPAKNCSLGAYERTASPP